MQQRNLLWLTLIVLFILETTIFHWIIPLSWQENMHISPHFMLIVILFISLYVNRHLALILGLVFGLLQDIVFYGYMIGPNAFGIGLVGYLIGYMFRRANANFFVAIPIIMLGVLSYSMIIYG